MTAANLRDAVFAILCVAAGISITIGVVHLSVAAGWITGGVLLAAWSWLVLGEV